MSRTQNSEVGGFPGFSPLALGRECLGGAFGDHSQTDPNMWLSDPTCGFELACIHRARGLSRIEILRLMFAHGPCCCRVTALFDAGRHLSHRLHCRRELAVRAAELFEQHVAERGVRLVDPNGVHKLFDVVVH